MEGCNIINKAERYGWTIQDTQGTMQWVHKSQLNVDKQYQRTAKQDRVHVIARAWSWVACGVIVVVIRKDGSYWIIDGQHRYLAAMGHEEISALPCIVFHVNDASDEAKGFVASNTVRGPVDSYSKFRALLMSRDSLALDIKSSVESVGYFVGPNAGKREIACVAKLMTCFRLSRRQSLIALHVASILCGGDHYISKDLFGGLVTLERHMERHSVGTILDKSILKKLLAAGPEQIESAIRSRKLELDMAGDKVCADAIRKIVNFRRKNQIPSLFIEG